MIQTSTHDLLVLYAYGEATPEQQLQIAQDISANPALLEELNEISKTKKMMTERLLSPSETSVGIILRHSQQSEQLQEI